MLDIDPNTLFLVLVATSMLVVLPAVLILLRKRTPTGYTVRLDWSDGRHSFFGYRPNADKAERLRERYARYYRELPHVSRDIQLTGTSVAPISFEQYRRHTRNTYCSAPNCPGQPATDSPA